MRQNIDDVEARARSFAKDKLVIAIERPIEFFGREVYWLNRNGGREFMIAIHKSMARSGTHWLRLVIEYARLGEDEADLALREYAVEIIDSGAAMPTFLQVYLADAHLLPIASRHPGPKRKSNFIRNIAILVLVALVSEEFGLKPTRAYGFAKRPCGCSIVADALGEAKRAGAIELQAPTEQAVAAIWKRYSPIAFPNGLLKST
jgi:hypothetical protein